jgi:formate C-acetyltransferase
MSHDKLIDARNNPGKYPGLLVRVSGYSAYFDDLNDHMKKRLSEEQNMISNREKPTPSLI